MEALSGHAQWATGAGGWVWERGGGGKQTRGGAVSTLPSVEVDTQAPGAKLEGDLSLRDKEVAARDLDTEPPEKPLVIFCPGSPRPWRAPGALPTSTRGSW